MESSQIQKETELESVEKVNEIAQKLKKTAQNVLKCLNIQYDLKRGRGQNLLIVTDEGVPAIVQDSFIEEARSIVGNDLRVVVSKKPEQLAKSFGESTGQKLEFSDKIILLTSMSRTHSVESKEAVAGISNNPEVRKLQKQRQTKRSSMFAGKSSIFSITRANNIDLLTEGAALENLEEMWPRIENFVAKFKNATRAFITTNNGTNLEIKIRQGTIAAESGKLDQPGNIANFPFGEVGCVPSWEGTNGVLVVDGVGGKAGATTNNGRLLEPISLFIENGVVIKIDGGQEAIDFWQYLEKIQSDYLKKNPEGKGNVFKLAEFSFGMNNAAWRNIGDKKILPPTQLEAEKALGTIHVALGNNALLLNLGGFGSDDKQFNDIGFHSDQVILKPTVVIENSEGDKIDLLLKGDLKI